MKVVHLLGAAVSLFCAAVSLGAVASARNFIVLHRFSGADGSEPTGPLIADGSGNLYGETLNGGGNGAGVVFELSLRGTRWKERVLHSFSEADGMNPFGGLTLDLQGNLYGTTFGGTSGGGGGVFELSADARGGGRSFTQVHNFGSVSDDGTNPYGGVFRDSSGNLYGTTYYGGEHYCGTVFELSPAQGGGWSESVLHSFRDTPDGAYPASALIRDEAGNFYGTTTQGGTGHCGDGDGDKAGCGTVFALTLSHKRLHAMPLYEFHRDEENMPSAPLTLGAGGALYGTAGYDVFVLMPQNRGGWRKQTVYEFKEGIKGTIPSSGLTFDAQGNLYGTTSSSGLYGYSTVYELSPPAQEGQEWTRVTLAGFSKGFDGAQPRGGVLIGPGGTLFGAADGQPGYIFAITNTEESAAPARVSGEAAVVSR